MRRTMEEYSIHPTELHHETWEEILAILRQHVALEELRVNLRAGVTPSGLFVEKARIKLKLQIS
jgi:hypothetical protein